MPRPPRGEKEGDGGGRGGRGGGGRGGGGGGGRGGGGGGWEAERQQWIKLVQMLKKDDMLPVVVFSFSKKRCRTAPTASPPGPPLISREVRRSRLRRAVAGAPAGLRSRPAAGHGVDAARRNIGIAGGLLPIMKETVEILFGRGLVKVLFATETFAMGVNMPARTVVFNGTRKHDGRGFRTLEPGEFTQMAGRSGRRGLDAVGNVIQACWPGAHGGVPDEHDLMRLLKGKSTLLSSQFRLTYTMILNLLRVEDMTVEEMLKRSFSEFRTQQALDAKRGGSGGGSNGASGTGAARHRAARGATCASCLRRTRDARLDKASAAGSSICAGAVRCLRPLCDRRSSFVRSSASMRSLATAAWRRWHPVEWCS